MAETDILQSMGSPASNIQKYLSIRTEDSPPSPSLFNGKEALIIIGFISTVYFLTGPNAMAFCNLLTSLPMAYFSFKILVRNSTSTEGYKSVVFYWSVFGLFATADQFCSEFLGYYVIKCSVLLAIFYNVAQQNLDVFREITGSNAESVHHEMMATQPNTTVNSTVTDNSEESGWNSGCHGIARALTPFPDQVAADFEEFESRICAGRDLSQFSIQPEDSLAHVHLTESKCTVAMAFGDIITNPINMVELFPNVPKMVTVVNCSTENIMWALKCNALHRLGAYPACGVIASGATISIRLLFHGNETTGDENQDKLAIDYSLVGSTRQYSPSFVERNDKKRHLLRISYKK